MDQDSKLWLAVLSIHQEIHGRSLVYRRQVVRFSWITGCQKSRHWEGIVSLKKFGLNLFWTINKYWPSNKNTPVFWWSRHVPLGILRDQICKNPPCKPCRLLKSSWIELTVLWVVLKCGINSISCPTGNLIWSKMNIKQCVPGILLITQLFYADGKWCSLGL